MKHSLEQSDEACADVQRKLDRAQQQLATATDDSYAWKAQAQSAQAAVAKLEERVASVRHEADEKLAAKVAEA